MAGACRWHSKKQDACNTLCFAVFILYLCWSFFALPKEGAERSRQVSPRLSYLCSFCLGHCCSNLSSDCRSRYGTRWLNLFATDKEVPTGIPRCPFSFQPWNEEVGIAAAMHSVAQADYPHLELIVIDDGSTDGTYQQIKQAAARISADNQNGVRFRRVWQKWQRVGVFDGPQATPAQAAMVRQKPA
jgi:hypothetical protein